MSIRDSQNELDLMRHSFAHVLATAVYRLFPNTRMGIGAVIENGFYHDFQFENPIGKKDLEKIEEEMNKIIKEELPFVQMIISRNQAFDILNLQGQIFKTKILNSIPDDNVSFYKTGNEFIDLCRGPHVEHTGKLGVFKLISISGVFWNNDENRPELQRIKGYAFKTQADLEVFEEQQQIKKEKDHRKLAKRLEFYTINPDNGSGLPIWLPKGQAVISKIMNYVYKENLKLGYKYISTPILQSNKLIEKTYEGVTRKSNLFEPIRINDEEQLELQTSPIINHLQTFNSKKRSYRDLPYKTSEFAKIFKNEQKGELSGLMNVREYISDFNSIICTKDDVKQELTAAIKQNVKTYNDFGLKNFKIELSTSALSAQPNISEKWIKAENKLIESLKNVGLAYQEIPPKPGAQGPSISFIFNDVFERQWQLGKIELNLTLANKFRLEYIDSTNKQKPVHIITRSALGSVERFFATLVEIQGGFFPLWLAPIQVTVIPISEKFIEYAKTISDELIERDIHAFLDKDPETMQNKIREAQLEMIPYMVIIGEKEQTNKTISVRPRSGQDLGMMKIEEFIEKVHKEINEKAVF